jgi:hypothetical protein
MLVGVYAAKYARVLAEDTPWPHADGIDLAGTCDLYELRPDERLADLTEEPRA